ncbi:YolD-like family protein [Metabacillus schmidteae]|uniref:YolD-like family protein n=1 Tax=Metabacillus schmidteae TaxID=2730405 RepID=UPI00158F57A0|nr:YolD-like family protein [Metabacillus schmidteae]
MAIRDRGKLKWQSAFFMPEHVKMLQDLKRDDQKVGRPILDEYQIVEFEQKICLAMEFSYQVKVKTWEKGFFKCYTGLLHRLDEINKTLIIEQEEQFIYLRFSYIVGIELVEG